MLTMIIWFLVSLVVTLFFLNVIAPWVKSRYSVGGGSYLETFLLGVEVIGIISTAFAFLGLVLYLIDYALSDYKMHKDIGHRGVLVRMIEEDYDSQNLENALLFNAKQKLSAYYNSSPWSYCKVDCYSLDTIPIPSHRYTPTDFVKLDAVLKHTSNKQDSCEK